MAPGPLAILIWAIVGGMTTMGDPAVVGIAHRPIACGDAPTVTCTGVLVGPRVVLTAAHCIEGSEGSAGRGGLEVIFGSDAAAPSAVIIVQATQAFAQYIPSTGDGDLALLLLAEDAPVAPIGRPTGGVTDLANGAPLRAVGFGVTGWTVNDPGIKREGTLALGAVGSARFDASPSPAMTCTADSGGPVFGVVGNFEQLVGITSRGDSACAANAVNARVDIAQASFIDPYIANSGAAPVGWPASISFTTTFCSADDQCPALMTCNDQHQCGFNWLGAGAFGAGCTTDAGCGTGRCVRAWPSGGDACHCFSSSMTPPGDDSVTNSPPEGCCDGGGGGSATSALLLLALAGTAKRKLFHARDERRA